MISVLLDGLWQGAIVVAIAAVVTALVPQRHAATRYAVWYAALIALVLVPLSGLLSFATPASVIPGSVIRTTTVVSRVAEQTAGANATWLTVLWIAGVTVCLVRLLSSHFRIARILQSASPAPELGPHVVVSSRISVPIAAGLLKPFVVIPETLAASVDAIDLATIVAHERAHVARRDILGNLIQRIVESVLFFNPWVYVIGRQLVKEREAACDDVAVNDVDDPERYASCLASLALRGPRVPSPLLTPSAIGSGRMLVDRIARLMNGKVAQVKTNHAVVAAAVALFAVLGFVLQAPRGLASTASGSGNTQLDPKCWADVRVINPLMPEIPDAVLKKHGPGDVTDLVTVTAHGNASEVKLVKSSGNVTIDGAVAYAAAHSTYKPEVRNCKVISGGQYLFHAEFGPKP